MKCPNCGTEHNFNFCPNCGYKAQQQAPVSTPSIPNTPQQYAPEAPQYEPPYNTPEYVDQSPKKGGLRVVGRSFNCFSLYLIAYWHCYDYWRCHRH